MQPFHFLFGWGVFVGDGGERCRSLPVIHRYSDEKRQSRYSIRSTSKKFGYCSLRRENLCNKSQVNVKGFKEFYPPESLGFVFNE